MLWLRTKCLGYELAGIQIPVNFGDVCNLCGPQGWLQPPDMQKDMSQDSVSVSEEILYTRRSGLVDGSKRLYILSWKQLCGRVLFQCRSESLLQKAVGERVSSGKRICQRKCHQPIVEAIHQTAVHSMAGSADDELCEVNDEKLCTVTPWAAAAMHAYMHMHHRPEIGACTVWWQCTSTISIPIAA